MNNLLIKSCALAVFCAAPLLAQAQAQMMPGTTLILTPSKANITIKVSGYCSGSTAITADTGMLMLSTDPNNQAFNYSMLQISALTDADESISFMSMLGDKPSLQINKGKLKLAASATGMMALMPMSYSAGMDEEILSQVPFYLNNVTCKDNTSPETLVNSSSMSSMMTAIPSGKSKLSISGNTTALNFNFVAKSVITIPYQQCTAKGTLTSGLAGIATDTFASSCKSAPIKITFSAIVSGDASVMDLAEPPEDMGDF